MLKLSFGPMGIAALTEIAFLQSPWSHEPSFCNPCTHWAWCGLSPSLGKFTCLPNTWQIFPKAIIDLASCTSPASLLKEKGQNNSQRNIAL